MINASSLDRDQTEGVLEAKGKFIFQLSVDIKKPQLIIAQW